MSLRAAANFAEHDVKIAAKLEAKGKQVKKWEINTTFSVEKSISEDALLKARLINFR